ncbi:sensor histidine kinase [Paenibacillus lutimineralis]|uniref:histidine kinase n=1 Tax=Paenibacillus lutimineralis TaxID=2707005 RepID=A0A3Q9I944_9BACL|nr:ATP-binding protein [Paenibacillus lutimineralis]AZS15513.1 sensor histidine kinase [Paenibacillus lutimineralis]
MAKRQRSVSLSFVLLRFAIVMLCCMLLCCLVWYFVMVRFQNTGVTYQGAVSNQQVEQMLAGEPTTFVSPGDDFLAEYALFGRNGEVLESNVEGKKLEALAGCLQEDASSIDVLRHTYADGSTVILRWHFRAEFVNPVLRDMLPPAEYLGLAMLVVALLLCLLFNTLWLRRRLAAKLKLFSEVSKKVGAQELDFTIPHAGIREYDQALDAMEHMREALYRSLSSQWEAQQEREAEMAALAHDLKTPLTLVGGNAELLLDEELPESSRKMVETIVVSNDRAKQYVAGLLETSTGANEAFENTCLTTMFDELCQSTIAIAEAKRVCLQTQNGLKGAASIQKDHLLRALGNVVQNAIEHTPAGGNVYLESSMIDGGWQVTVCDEGPGFSKAALHHATERLWRGDAARGADGHNGLGLWFAAQVAKTHGGQLELRNCDSGGVVIMKFCKNL